MAKGRAKRVVKQPASAANNSDSSRGQQVEKKLVELSSLEVERRVTAISAIRDAENENLLTRLRLLRSYFSVDQHKILAFQFFKENVPNLSVIFNEDGEYELKWSAKADERNICFSHPHRTSIAHIAGSTAALPDISGFEFSSKAVRASFLEAANLHVPDIALEEVSETMKLGFDDSLQTPGTTSQRLSVGITPKRRRLPKHGEVLLSVRGSPLGFYREDSMEAIHESEEG